jgi:hypothetical protein
MNKYIFALFAVMLLVAGCASSVTKDIMVDAEADPKTNFTGYTTYTWLGSAAIVYDPDGKWEPPQFDADAEIEFLIDRELRGRGMSEDSVNPDMLVAYAAGIDMDSMDIKIDPESDLTVLVNVPLGALTVILIDADTGLAIWGGVASAEIQQNPSQETIKKRLDFAVTQMFKKLPK